MEKADYQRVRSRAVRADPCTAHLAIGAFASGQITIPVPTRTLTEATGLTRQQLADAELTAMAYIAARADTDVRPHDWRLPTAVGAHPVTRQSALSAVAA